ncbi:MAG: cyclohexanecarboxylate-CoA ligase [Frankiaceae bacterium]|jgi:acyl-CoA synthetase (AMP-forming)/AMP-acid ligase II|nr:cyclohexanecarboxylate-CoA ligase [Frankiaceae bacterium]
MTSTLLEAPTIWELVRRRAEVSGERVMLLDTDGRRVTFGELETLAERVAAGLLAQGVGPGTTVTWQLPTRIDSVVVSMALARLGAVQNPILHLYREREVGAVLRQSRPDFFVVPGVWRDRDFGAMAKSLGADLERAPVVVEIGDQPPTGDAATLPPPPSSGTEMRWVYYTSGTTSEPKGAQHSDQTLMAGGRGLAAALDMAPDDIGSIAFPYSHIAGPDYLLMMLAAGFGAVLVEAFVPSDAVAAYRDLGVTMCGGSTAFYQMFLAEQRKSPETKIIPTLRIISGGGAAKPAELFYDVEREMGVKLVHGYGMTEIPMIAMGSPHDTDEQLATTEGKPVVGAEVRIVKEDGSVAAPEEEGEVRVRGPVVMLGYTDPVATAAAFDEAGWFRTGDLGVLRSDGHLRLTGRLKDVIIRKGENISARELEEVLFTHPSVGDVAVIGLPDADRGELVCAVVEASGDGGAPLTFDDMVRWCRDAGMMTQKIPERLEIVDRLPRNETLNKVLKYKLRAQFAPPAGGQRA